MMQLHPGMITPLLLKKVWMEIQKQRQGHTVLAWHGCAWWFLLSMQGSITYTVVQHIRAFSTITKVLLIGQLTGMSYMATHVWCCLDEAMSTHAQTDKHKSVVLRVALPTAWPLHGITVFLCDTTRAHQAGIYTILPLIHQYVATNEKGLT